MEYRIVSTYSATFMDNDPFNDMEAKINKLIREGWRPSGGIAITSDQNTMVLLQAMTRNKDD